MQRRSDGLREVAGVVGESARLGWVAGGMLGGGGACSQRMGSIGRRGWALSDAIFQSQAES